MTDRFAFKGTGVQAPYFEGWYVKITDAQKDFSLALIPGLALFSEKECFVQYNLYYKGKSVSGKITYPVDTFAIVDDPYSVLMPLFVLSEKGVKAHLEDEENDLLIDLEFGEFLPLEQSRYSPSIMGPLEYIKVPCSHDVVSLSHSVTGKVIANGEKITIDAGRGYMEKDRGSTFPDRYIWAQSNDFIENEQSSLFIAVADIDFTIVELTGAIAVYHDGDREHRFATYYGTRSKVVMDEDQQGYTVKLTDVNKSLEVKVRLENSHELIAPMNAGMDYPIKETVKAAISVTFKEKNSQPVYLTTQNGAAEAVNWN